MTEQSATILKPLLWCWQFDDLVNLSLTTTTDYDDDPLDQKELNTELSEDTDCDGSSLPEDSPEV